MGHGWHNQPLKFVPAAKSAAYTGLANALRLAECSVTPKPSE